MNRLAIYATFFIVLFIPLNLICGCKAEINNEEYLQSVYNTLDKIKSATYYFTCSASAPGDTLSFSDPQHLYIKEFVNPADEFVGASSITYYQQDTTKIHEFYDGLVRGKFDWEEKTIKIDSFQNNPYPFRLVVHPFYTKTKNIIKYALETDDSTKMVLKDFGDSIQFSLLIYDKVLEFVTQPFVNTNPFESSIGKISQYDIWISKSDNLPYRMRRKMNHQTSFERCTNTKLNTTQDVKLISTDYFPENFSIVQFKRETRKRTSPFEGKVAPDWSLMDLQNNTVGLRELKSKVLLIQFTGVGCGPCHASIPFLKQLVNEYSLKEFEVIAIEFWSNNIEGLRRYIERNDLNFKFLKADENVIRNYQLRGAPAFFILDEKRVVRKVINGYSRGTTGNEIRDVITELL